MLTARADLFDLISVEIIHSRETVPCRMSCKSSCWVVSEIDPLTIIAFSLERSEGQVIFSQDNMMSIGMDGLPLWKRYRSIILDHCQTDRPVLVTFEILFAGGQMGTVLGMPISGLLCQWFGWESVFYFFGKSYAAVLLCVLVLLFDISLLWHLV